jgi:hypothetical protein
MKLFRSFVQNLSRKAIGKKIITTAIATAVMGVVTLLYRQYGGDQMLVVPAPAVTEEKAAEVVQVEPRGLSRSRSDFEKAVNILAEAADKNNHLAKYYERVSSRVKGEAGTAEHGSGVRVVKARKNSKDGGATVASVKADSKDMKDYAGSPMVASAQPLSANDSSRDAGAVKADYGLEGIANLTVGDMTFEMNPAIERWINYYTNTTGGRNTLNIGLKRSRQFIEMSREEFRRLGVPEDLIWLAMVESVWNPTAVSPAAAGGLWQFIPKTAMEYGLKVETGNDERNDPLKQTRVAAEYLRDLYTIFGDWALAMAAYNSGEPRVMDAIVKNGRANFWELYDKQLLPKETRDYVPKILAAIKVVGDLDGGALATVAKTAPGSKTEVVFSGR